MSPETREKVIERAAWEGVRAAFQEKRGTPCTDETLAKIQGIHAQTLDWDVHLIAGRAAARAALALLREDDGWQDISTAPRDGTPVLILQPSGKAAVGLWDKVDNGWRLSVRFVTRTFPLEAGHWQPIPPLLSRAKEQQG